MANGHGVEALAGHIESNIFGKLKTNFIAWSFLPWFAYLGGVAPNLSMVWITIGWIGIGGGLIFSYVSAYLYSRQFIDAYDTLKV